MSFIKDLYIKDEETIENARDNESFSSYMRNIVKNIEETQRLSKEIWLPSFKKTVGLSQINDISCLKTVKMICFIYILYINIYNMIIGNLRPWNTLNSL